MMVYVAGKYTARTVFGRMVHILRARKYSKMLIRAGAFVYTPHVQTALMDNLQPYEFFMEYHLKFLNCCEVLFLLPGWERSSGAKIEHKYAKGREIPIYYPDEIENLCRRVTVAHVSRRNYQPDKN